MPSSSTDQSIRPEVEVIEFPVIDLEIFLKDPETAPAQLECKKVADSLINYGVLVVRDSRATEDYNSQFIDMMERYFEQPYEEKLKDARPQFHYQVGATPGNTEDPKCKVDKDCQDLIYQLPLDSRPLPANGPDPKWRFFWKMGKAPEKTSFADLNAAPVLPAAFPEWEAIMNSWGTRMHDAVTGISQMLAVGLGLPKNTFSDMAKYGPHLLAPTGSDLNEYGAIDTVLAGFHYDLNFLTIHGKSRFPGLNVWARNSSRKIGVKVPSGCLLVQAGKEAEWLTGGKILAGYHEVVVNNKTIEAMQTARNEGRSLWRVSSTFFMHIGSDVLLQPVVLPAENQEEAKAKYPPTLCGTYVQNELFHINLKAQ
ncbi:hypothetical protein DSO57_1016503 [Entomophthora muscae]|uniref:Uncharacterized protein n=1 Tax=Entomophthora muscae TaxID=34485 RepID=A0ACC2UF62_9FUNG|nr:hypothetical protein DSO57_1016503 [Entomophthora muscae]